MRRGSLPVADLLSAGRLVKQVPDRVALTRAVNGAELDVLASNANIATFSPWADAMLYEAGLRSARVIVQAAGYRIDAGAGAHIPPSTELTPSRATRMMPCS